MPARNESSAPARGRRSGFTLVEVLVAIAVSGLLLLGARTLLDAVAADAERIALRTAEVSREANAERLLRSVIGRIDVGGADPSTRRLFGGDGRRMRFDTWCDVPAGWQERCTALLTVDSLGRQPTLALVLSPGEVIQIRSGFRTGTLRYLESAADGGVWRAHWPHGITLPVAVGVILDGDTSIVRIGDRA